MSSNPQRTIKQFLTSLHQAGISHVPRPKAGGGDLRIHLQQPVAASPLNKPVLESRRPTAHEVRETTQTSQYIAPATGPIKEAAKAEIVASSVATENVSAHIAPTSSLNLQERIDALQVLQNEVAGCTKCTELAQTRTQTVFGTGNPQARLVFLGEAPGADEDKQGKPFVGKAGEKLTEIIEKGMKLSRSEFYILNVLKCRPPGNRNPTDQEARNCRDFLDRQLQIIQPEFICCLGGVAATNLLDSKLTIGRLRGKFYDYQGIRVMATYHPAYLLRNPSARKQVWEDIQMLMQEMGLATQE